MGLILWLIIIIIICCSVFECGWVLLIIFALSALAGAVLGIKGKI